MIWVIGGTVETHELLKKLNGKLPYTVTIATEGGRQFTSAYDLRVGRLSKEEMVQWIKEKNITAIADLSHPFAREVSASAQEAGEICSIPYFRYVRPYNHRMEDGVFVSSVEEACEFLQGIEGTVFFTTGSKNIPDWEKVRGDNRFIYRVLPSTESMKIAEESRVKMKDIIGILGPFSSSFNGSFFRRYRVKYCVTKESGAGGGVDEKLKACREEGVIPIVILRTPETGYNDMDTMMEDMLTYEKEAGHE